MTITHTHSEHEQHTAPADIAYRKSGRYEISLLFEATTRELTVSVLDEITGVICELPVHADEALEVFNHPFAHPAFEGVAFHDERADTRPYA
jgi:hypothetical protein